LTTHNLFSRFFRKIQIQLTKADEKSIDFCLYAQNPSVKTASSCKLNSLGFKNLYGDDIYNRLDDPNVDKINVSCEYE